MDDILTEITKLSDLECLHIDDNRKSGFTCQLHRHSEFELNFIEHGAGAIRIVGDNMESIDDYDLVLICSESLEHTWEDGVCQSGEIREITIQFSHDFFAPHVLAKNQFDSIRKMLKAADHGVSFSHDAVMRVYPYLDGISSETDRFTQLLKFLWILNELSKSKYEVLASSSFAKASRNQESRRVSRIKQYINDHYSENIRLVDLASMVGMSASAFSRFFKARTGKSLSDYLMDIRLGHAARMLVDSTDNIAEICYASGFNNLSNFNRIFKAKRGTTPRDFRALYKANIIF